MTLFLPLSPVTYAGSQAKREVNLPKIMQLERDRARTLASACLAPKPMLLTPLQAADGFS